MGATGLNAKDKTKKASSTLVVGSNVRHDTRCIALGPAAKYNACDCAARSLHPSDSPFTSTPCAQDISQPAVPTMRHARCSTTYKPWVPSLLVGPTTNAWKNLTCRARAHLHSCGLHFRRWVRRLANAHHAHHVLFLQLSQVEVQVVGLGSIHDHESELLPLHQRRLGRHRRAPDPVQGRVARCRPTTA